MQPRVGFAELEQWPEDGLRYELYDGEVCVVPTPMPRHQRIVLEVAKHLDAYAAMHGGEALVSPIDIVFSEYDVLQPDVVFFQASRRHLITPDKAIRSAPDLAVEVLSPSTAGRDRGRKMQIFARYGVTEYWIIDPPARSVEIFWLNGKTLVPGQSISASGMVTSTVLPELQFPAAALFRE